MSDMSRESIAKANDLPVDEIKCYKCHSYEEAAGYCTFWKVLKKPDDYCSCILTEVSGTIHEVKILPEYFKPVKDGTKTFEIRKNDRNYQVGDSLILKEWDVEGYTGEELTKKIVYIYEGNDMYGLRSGYCILGLG